jgi:hypothetical protein
MRKRLFPTVPATAVLLLLTVAVPAHAAPAADPAAPVLESITLSQTAVTVTGVQTVFVGVQVRITDDAGVEPTSSNEESFPSIEFGPPPLHLLLTRTGGTAQDGLWTALLPITSALKGLVKPTRILAYSTDFHLLDVDPATVLDVPGVTVRSSHRPAVDLTFPSEPLTRGKPVVEHVRAWDTDTGLPWKNLPLVLGTDNGCVENTGARSTARTGTAGTYQRTLSAASAPWLQCVWVPGATPPGGGEAPIIAADSAFPRYSRFAVSAAPAKPAVPAGTNVDVNGSVRPVEVNKTVQLQRLSGRVWRTVGTGRVRASGRYTVVATPPGRAAYSYRVYAPGDSWAVGGSSKAIPIRGT